MPLGSSVYLDNPRKAETVFDDGKWTGRTRHYVIITSNVEAHVSHDGRDLGRLNLFEAPIVLPVDSEKAAERIAAAINAAVAPDSDPEVAGETFDTLRRAAE